MSRYTISGYEIDLSGDLEKFAFSLTGSEVQNGLVHIRLKMESDSEAIPNTISLNWNYPGIEIHSKWNPNVQHNRNINATWGIEPCKSKATNGAPIQTLLNYNGVNKLTVAVSDALNPIEIKAGLKEESGEISCTVSLFTDPMQPRKNYEVILRLDSRDIPYYESIKQVQEWWASMPHYKPAAVPEYARLPMYSTWYSFHQGINSVNLLDQCRYAKEIGCESIIVDSGWDTEPEADGNIFPYCGDWEVTTSKFPDMKEFVKDVHDKGLKYMMWYSLPFFGKHSKIFSKFTGKYLSAETSDWSIIDPRFPEVREYIINIFEKAVKEWDLDGLKLDFIDNFRFYETPKFDNGRDFRSLEEAVDKLLKDTMIKLRAIKPDIMIEFRQSYIGPLMRTYGNMFRAGDCPNDSLSNRIRIIDLRLLSGNTAVHSDMLMWDFNDTVESAAMQIINVLFSVLQISVRINELPQDHRKMLNYWMDFWLKNKEVLIDGEIMPLHPEANYSAVISIKSNKMIAVSYSCPVINIPDTLLDEMIIVNGSYEKQIIINRTYDNCSASYKISDCMGSQLSQGIIDSFSGLIPFAVPAAGTVIIKKEM